MKKFPAYGRSAPGRSKSADFEEQLRADIVGRLHTGLLRPGDRLPSIRDISDRSGVDHRVVARAYRALEAEGMIIIRHQAGVFVAAVKAREGTEDERTAWAAEVLLQSWERGLTRSSFFGMLGGSVTSGLRCGCLESNEDHMVALCAEIELGFSVEAVPLRVDPSPGPVTSPPAGLDEVDIVATSVFHAQQARAAVGEAELPVVVLSVGKDFTAEIRRRAQQGPLTTVIADPRYAERARAYLNPTLRNAVSFVTIDEVERVGVDLNSEQVIATRAARRSLGLEDYHLIRTPASLLCRESAADLCGAIARVASRRSA
ncbi:MAG: winged helix-turn-helix domain-containing protein [Gemmatimonadetes bacterium]|nr:winged helix-turn-helix domain-containing protein [Gemmatimonadota bacterium]